MKRVGAAFKFLINWPKTRPHGRSPAMRLPTCLRRPALRLATRLSIGVVLVVLGVTVAIATVVLHMSKEDMRVKIGNAQFSRLTAIASAIDQKFDSRQVLLRTFAESVLAQHFRKASDIQDFLERHRSLKDAFDNVSFIDKDGNLVANLNGAQQIGRINVKDRPYFIDTVATKSAHISQPIRNRLNGLAQVVMTEPILGANGQVDFVMTGSINLQEPNFLGELAHIKFGKSGYMFILNTDGIVIDHPQKDRILQNSKAAGGSNFASQRALEGFEGTTESLGRDGIAALYSYKRVARTNWIVGARFPSSEAFQPIQEIERTAWLGALTMALLSGALALAILRRQLAPLAGIYPILRLGPAWWFHDSPDNSHPFVARHSESPSGQVAEAIPNRAV